MIQIPDAPWIRDAEMYGDDPPPEAHCPCCGDECENLYVDSGGEVVGCEHCVETVDAWDWEQAHREEYEE